MMKWDSWNELYPLHFQLFGPVGDWRLFRFHSLEDRLVKHFFKDCTSHNAPKDAYGNPMIPPTGKILTRKGIAGTEDPHPRARSARLRSPRKL